MHKLQLRNLFFDFSIVQKLQIMNQSIIKQIRPPEGINPFRDSVLP